MMTDAEVEFKLRLVGSKVPQLRILAKYIYRLKKDPNGCPFCTWTGGYKKIYEHLKKHSLHDVFEYVIKNSDVIQKKISSNTNHGLLKEDLVEKMSLTIKLGQLWSQLE